MKNLLMAVVLAAVSLVANAKTFTLKSSLSGQDFNWADGNNYEGEPYPGPQSGDTVVVPSGMTAMANTTAAAQNGVCGVCEICIESGAVVQMPTGSVERKTNIYFGKLTGTGTVSNPNSVRQDILILKSCEFGGKFEGKLDYGLRNGVTFAFTDSDQCFTAGSPILYDTSTLKVYRFFPKTASATKASVLGRDGNFNFGTRNTIQYIGEPGLRETLNRSYWGGNYITYDAGAYGGLTISGYTTASASQRVFILTGSNQVASVYYSDYDYRSSNKNPGYAYTRKEGSGTWILRSANNNYTGGVIDINEGTLQIETLAEKGVNCALGLSTNLLAYGTAVTADRAVDYAIIVGGGEYPAKLEYIGGTSVSCSTRPLIVTNSGAIASSQGTINFSDISAAGLGAHTLILSGDGAITNTAGMVRDGTRGGKLNILKEGTCGWNLDASGDITGTLKVNGGVLSAKVPDRKYHWYRVWITENAYGSSRYDTTYSSTATGQSLESEKSYIQFAELALYDADGKDLALGCAPVDKLAPRQISPSGDYSVMNEGEVAYGRLTTVTPNNINGFFGNICNGLTTQEGAATKTRFACAVGGVVKSDSSTWVPYVFRLPADAGPVVRVDIAQSLTTASTKSNPGRCEGRNPTAFQVDASADGLHWDTNIASADMELKMTGVTAYYWLESGSTAAGLAADRINAGWELSQTEPSGGTEFQNHYQFESVSVANGGIFESSGGVYDIDCLVLDASAGAGSFRNVAFPKKGTLRVENYPAGLMVLPIYVGNLSTRDNLCNWTIIVNGKVTKRPLCINADGYLEFVSGGFKILYRQ